MLRHVGYWQSNVRMPWSNIVAPTWANDYNIIEHPQMCNEKFDQFQIWDNPTNMPQQVATPNGTSMLLLTMLRYVSLKCCDRLAGALDYSQCFRFATHRKENAKHAGLGAGRRANWAKRSRFFSVPIPYTVKSPRIALASSFRDSLRSFNSIQSNQTTKK